MPAEQWICENLETALRKAEKAGHDKMAMRIRLEDAEAIIAALGKQVSQKVKVKDWCPVACPRCGKVLSESLGDGYYDHYTHM